MRGFTPYLRTTFISRFSIRHTPRPHDSPSQSWMSRSQSSMGIRSAASRMNTSSSGAPKSPMNEPSRGKGKDFHLSSASGFKCQIPSLYSWMVRSVEKAPDLAVFVIAILSHLSLSV